MDSNNRNNRNGGNKKNNKNLRSVISLIGAGIQLHPGRHQRRQEL